MRRTVERLLRLTGSFRTTKRALQYAQTAGMRAATAYHRSLHSKDWPERRRENLVMFHTGRSGSYVLADLLANHPDIRWDGELFNYDLLPWRARPKPRLQEAGRRIQRRLGYANVPFYGFEVLATHLAAGQIELPAFVDRLEEMGIHKFVILTRRNILRKIVSNHVARARGHWHLAAGQTAPLTQIDLDPKKVVLARSVPLIDHIRAIEADYRALREALSGRRTLELVFEEDIAGGPQRAFSKICTFMSASQQDLPVRHGRTTPQSLREIIRNFDEVERALSGTDLAWMLEDKDEPS